MVTLARLAVILSKLPVTTAGVSINRFCSSGLQSICDCRQNQIASGQTEVAIAGGVDSILYAYRVKSLAKLSKNSRLVEEKPDVFMAMGNTGRGSCSSLSGYP